MGTIGQKLARSLQHELAAFPHDDDDDLQDIELDKELQELANFPQQLLEEECHPFYSLYMIAESLLTVFTQDIIDHKLFEEFFDIIDQVNSEFIPDYPPMSPVTNTFFSAWSQYDFRFGEDLETLTTCLIENADQFDILPEMKLALQSLQDSRMGIYEHCGLKNDYICLKELITGDIFECYNPTGYQGQTGELWFVCRCEPPFEDSDCSILYTTPYILTGTRKTEWIEYLERSLMDSEFSDQRDALHDFMKYGHGPEMWLNYIMDGYSDFQNDAIFLTGIPDIEESLPRALGNDGFTSVPSFEEYNSLTLRNNLFSDHSTLKNNLVSVSKQNEILEEDKLTRTVGLHFFHQLVEQLPAKALQQGEKTGTLIHLMQRTSENHIPSIKHLPDRSVQKKSVATIPAPVAVIRSTTNVA